MNQVKTALGNRWYNTEKKAETEREKALSTYHMSFSVLFWLVKDEKLRDEYIEYFDRIFVVSPSFLQKLSKIVEAEHKKGSEVTMETLAILSQKPSNYGLEIDEEERHDYERFAKSDEWQALKKDFVIEHLKQFLIEQIHIGHAERTVALIEANEHEALSKEMKTASYLIDSLSTKREHSVIGLDYTGLIESVTQSKRRLSTGLVHTDCALGGGLARGEMMTTLGITKSGKSHLLVNQMFSNLMRGHNVLYLSFENGERDIQRRFMSRASGIFYDQMMRVEDHLVKGRIEEVMKRTAYLSNFGTHMIMHRPPNTVSVSDLPMLIKRMEHRANASPDLIIIDYADYMTLETEKGKRLESYEKYETLTYALVNFAQENDIGIATVTQVNRQGSAKKAETELIQAEHVARSIGKINAADYTFALNMFDRKSRYQYGYIQNLASRSTPIQDTLFPFRSMLGMSYYESLNVFDEEGVKSVKFPYDLHLMNKAEVVEKVKDAYDEDMQNFEKLLKPPCVEKHEAEEAKIYELLHMLSGAG